MVLDRPLNDLKSDCIVSLYFLRIDKERERLEKEIKRLQGSLVGIEKKLSNEKFVNNAPADVVQREKAKQMDWTENLNKLKVILSNLS